MRAWVVSIILIVGCGRVGFDADPSAGDGDGGTGDDADDPAGVQVLVMTGDGDDQLNDLAFHPDGAIAAVGELETTIEIGGQTITSIASGANDLFVTVLEPDGTTRWLDHAGATAVGAGNNVAWSGDTVLAGGYFGGIATRLGDLNAGAGQDALIAELSADGALVGAGHWGGGSNVQLRALETLGTLTAFGGVYAGTADFGAGALPATGGVDNGFLALGTSAGATASRAFNSGGDVYVNDLAIAPDGSVCVTGRTSGTVDFGGGPITASLSTAFVAVYDPQLVYRWARVLGAVGHGTGVAFTPDGDCVAAGTWSGTLTVSSFMATSAGDSDGYVLRFEGATGAARWLATAGGAELDGMFGVVAYPPDGIALAGMFTGGATIAGMPVQSEGTRDGFVAFLAGDGSLAHVELLAGAGAVIDGIAGIAVDPAGARVGAAIKYSGELRVRDVTRTATGIGDGAAVIVPIPTP